LRFILIGIIFFTIISAIIVVEQQKKEIKLLKEVIVKMRDFPDLETWEKWHSYQIDVELPDSGIVVEVYNATSFLMK